MRRSIVVACLAVMVAASASATAGELFWRVRAISISPDETSDMVAGTGSEVAVDSQITPELDLTWMFARHWGLELVLAAARHDLEAKGGALDGASLGSVWLIPPTLMLQYHFMPDGSARPYLGLGLTVATFVNYNVSSDLEAIGVKKLVLTDSVGPTAQAGLDLSVSPRWFVNFDVKYAKVQTDAKIVLDNASGDLLDTVTVDIDPWIFGVGFGYRF